MQKITIQTTINAPVEKVWDLYTNPIHIVKWNNASEDWHTPFANNDLRVGGRFLSRMEAKDGSTGFDFEGVYDIVDVNKLIKYVMPDGRAVEISFDSDEDNTKVTIMFDPENVYPIDMQRDGWQSILDNFKKYVDAYTTTLV